MASPVDSGGRDPAIRSVGNRAVYRERCVVLDRQRAAVDIDARGIFGIDRRRAAVDGDRAARRDTEAVRRDVDGVIEVDGAAFGAHRGGSEKVV